MVGGSDPPENEGALWRWPWFGVSCPIIGCIGMLGSGCETGGAEACMSAIIRGLCCPTTRCPSRIAIGCSW